MACWLMKSEPDEFSIDDLVRDKTVPWFGVRNYLARNYMRDKMANGDDVLFITRRARSRALQAREGQHGSLSG